MKVMSCYVTNYLLDLAYYEKRNYIEDWLDDVTKFSCACIELKIKDETCYRLILMHFKEKCNSSSENFEHIAPPPPTKKK